MSERRRRGITIGALLFVVCGAVCGFLGVRHVERAIDQDATSWLTANGFDGIDVDVQGRQVVLSGDAPPGTNLDQLADNVREGSHGHDHWWTDGANPGNDGTGIRLVNTDNVNVAGVAPTDIVDVAADFDGEAVILSGAVLTDAHRQELVSAANAEFGAANVTDNITVLGTGEQIAGADGRVTQLASLMPRMNDNLINGRASLRGAALAMTGVAATQAGLDSINADVDGRNGVSSLDTSSTVTFTAPAPDPTATPAPTATPVPPTPTPVPAPAAPVADPCDDIADLDLSDVQFEVNTAILTAAAQAVLDNAAVAVAACPDAGIQVQGHTDSDGPDDYNLQLSQDRADSVVAYLASQGVDGSRLTGTGFGESQPIADNNTPEGKAQNRRVELIVEGN